MYTKITSNRRRETETKHWVKIEAKQQNTAPYRFKSQDSTHLVLTSINRMGYKSQSSIQWWNNTINQQSSTITHIAIDSLYYILKTHIALVSSSFLKHSYVQMISSTNAQLNCSGSELSSAYTNDLTLIGNYHVLLSIQYPNEEEEVDRWIDNPISVENKEAWYGNSRSALCATGNAGQIRTVANLLVLTTIPVVALRSTIKNWRVTRERQRERM